MFQQQDADDTECIRQQVQPLETITDNCPGDRVTRQSQPVNKMKILQQLYQVSEE